MNKLPTVIKLKGLKLVKTETPYDISYSTVLESQAETISSAISKAVTESRKVEDFLEKTYNVVYSGFNFITKNKIDGQWLVVIETIFTKKDYYPEVDDYAISQIESSIVAEEEETAKPQVQQAKQGRAVVRYTHFSLIDKLVVMEVVDELEMATNRMPTIGDISFMAKKYGIEKPASIVNTLVQEEFLVREGVHVGRNQK